MPRSRFALAVGFALLAVTAVAASAAPLPSGTIDCDVNPTSILQFGFAPALSNSTPSPSTIGVKVPMAGICDNAGVVGGKAPITHLEATVRARLQAGSTCETIVSPGFPYDKLKIKLKWKSFDGTRFRTVATSTTHLSAGSFDAGSESVVFTSAVFRGAFAGSTSTIKLKLDNVAFMTGPCPPITGINWTAGGASTLTVQ